MKKKILTSALILGFLYTEYKKFEIVKKLHKKVRSLEIDNIILDKINDDIAFENYNLKNNNKKNVKIKNRRNRKK